MWVVKNSISGVFFAGFHEGMPITTKHEEQAHVYTHRADAAQVCSVLIGSWKPEPLISKN